MDLCLLQWPCDMRFMLPCTVRALGSEVPVHLRFCVLYLPRDGSPTRSGTHTVCRKDPVFRNRFSVSDCGFSWFSSFLPGKCRGVTERPRPHSSRIVLINKFWEELIAYFPLIRRGSHEKRRVQQFFYSQNYYFFWTFPMFRNFR